MTDVTAQNPNPNSYVDDYAPPAQVPGQAMNGDVVNDQLPPTENVSAQGTPTQPDASSPAPALQNNEDGADNLGGQDSEALEDQNIFDLLGISEAADSEKELFLDELQQVIWEDFVENDVELLLTSEELAEFKGLTDDSALSEDERQVRMIDYLEKLIPDLEKIMLEKALDLKEDMTRQRIADMMQNLANAPEKLDQVRQAQNLADNQQWRSVALTLNAIPVA